ncbi:hypothetical protein BU15DRAFT_64481 [Melanogaster broomeanus]|nr:hypothetical protein BU15DRAFT_64481 [Melanogaster broomeanus]
MSAQFSANAPKVSAPTLASSTWTPEAAKRGIALFDTRKFAEEEISTRTAARLTSCNTRSKLHDGLTISRRRRLHDEFSEGCLDVTVIPMSEVFAQWTARITFLPAAAASCARSLKTEPTGAWAGSDARERERRGLPDRGQTFLPPVVSDGNWRSASGAHAILNALMVKSRFSIGVRDGAVALEVTPKEDSVEYDVAIDKVVC